MLINRRLDILVTRYSDGTSSEGSNRYGLAKFRQDISMEVQEVTGILECQDLTMASRGLPEPAGHPLQQDARAVVRLADRCDVPPTRHIADARYDPEEWSQIRFAVDSQATEFRPQCVPQAYRWERLGPIGPGSALVISHPARRSRQEWSR